MLAANKCNYFLERRRLFHFTDKKLAVLIHLSILFRSSPLQDSIDYFIDWAICLGLYSQTHIKLSEKSAQEH